MDATVRLLTFGGSSGERVGGFVVNSSGKGLLVALDRPLPKGSEVGLALESAHWSTTVTGRVVWTRGLVDGCLVGLALDQASARS